ncbi:hypothetical protein [uncultured Christiangramia sp.]|uniref:hypothetical protein n=1 Tax=uncultured Christiangramia sp. TaxID=503836 RepID=UPI0026286493|nr:hypothetical protein [uncultured Christiangramia sp.]
MIKKIGHSKISSFFLFIGLFLWLFTNGGIVNWAVGLLLIILFMMIEKISLRRKSIVESVVLLALMLFALLRFEIFLRMDVSSLQADAVIGNTAKYILCIGVWLALRSIIKHEKAILLKSLIRPLLIINVVFFYTQFIVKLVTNFYIDAAKYIVGEESRYQGILNNGNGIGSFRATGFYVEPSNYFFTVLILSILLLLIYEFKSCKKLIIITILSMFLTLSTAAFFIGALYVGYIFYIQKVSWKFYVVITIITLPILIFSFSNIGLLYERQIERTQGNSGNMRMALLEEVYDRDSDHILTNYGLFAIDRKLFNLTYNFGGVSREVASINDSGLFIAMWAKFGLLGVLYFMILCLLQRKRSIMNLIFFLIISLTKVHLFTPVFILYLVVSLGKENFIKNSSNYIQEDITFAPLQITQTLNSNRA